ncbi:very short patch repair endonuclease [Williamsia muralis]|uniref:Very short patch repair endonuclease n=1 Tax=Williamsia marianensis TaxID=85044 RepID=A0ABU4ETG0_WILMA|nr:very short patch repair endonuclease [Williamsia muralis]MDV7134523.1 very short patch repair endonuclease [Williamsia muralis]
MSSPAIRGRDPEVTSRVMSKVRSRDTKPELALRRAIHARGGRYRLHPRDVVGTPDLVVRSKKVAVFVDGDLWHGNPAEWVRRGLPDLASMFPNRTEFWVRKIEQNVARDREVNATLRSSGWRVVRLWASDILADPDAAAGLVMASFNGDAGLE